MTLSDTVRDREIAVEQEHLDRVYRRLEEKLQEAEFILDDAARRVQVGTPGALAERDALVFRAGVHLNRLNSEFEDFLFGRIDMLEGKDGARGPDGAFLSTEPADGTVGEDGAASIAETLHIGRLGVLDADYAPLVIDWRAPAAAPFYRATPKDPGRVVRRRVIRSRGRRVLGVEDDLLRPELSVTLGDEGLQVVGDGALMAALGRARSHSMRDIVASIQAEQDLVIRAPAGGVTEVTGGPGTGKTAVALHRAAYLLYQDRRRYAGGILVVSPTPLLVAYTEGVLPSLGEEGQVAVRAVGSLVDGAEANDYGAPQGLDEQGLDEGRAYDEPAVARVKGSARMVRVLRAAARGALEAPGEATGHQPSLLDDDTDLDGVHPPPGRAVTPTSLRVVAFGTTLRLERDELARIRRTVLGGTAPVNLMRPRARRLLLDALWARTGRSRHQDRELAQEERAAFDEDVSTETAFGDFLDAWWPTLTPRGVLAAMADERRLAGWARRVLTGEEVRLVARSLKRLAGQGQERGRGRERGPAALSVHDVALLDELNVLLGPPPRAKAREIDPADQLTGLDEVTTYADRNARQRGSYRDREERAEYAHVIVDEAQDLTPMQWRLVGRRGAHATWTIVGDPAQSSWTDPGEAVRARDEALGSRSRRRFTLTTNYRNPAEIAELAARVLALAAPGTPSPVAVRSTGIRPRFAASGDRPLGDAVRAEVRRLLGEVDGTVGVVVAMDRRAEARSWLADLGDLGGRAVALGSLEAKGLEYDATVVVGPTEIAEESPAGLRVLYVALTRATQRLTVLSAPADQPDTDAVPALFR